MRARIALLLALTMSLLLAGSSSAQETPMLGANLSPSSLTMASGTASTTITNLGDVPVSIAAAASMSSTWTLPALGYRVTVEPSTLEPGQAATVTLHQDRAPASSLTLELLMGAAETQPGQDSTALRFPVPVTDPSGTSLDLFMTSLWTWAASLPLGWTL